MSNKIHEIFYKYARNHVPAEYRDIPAMTVLDYEKSVNELERIKLIDFLTWYMGDEHSKLPDDMIEIVNLYLND